MWLAVIDQVTWLYSGFIDAKLMHRSVARTLSGN